MVMAPPPGRARARRRRLSLRCLLGHHCYVLVTPTDPGSKWGVYLRYCRRCWRLDEAHARNDWW